MEVNEGMIGQAVVLLWENNLTVAVSGYVTDRSMIGWSHISTRWVRSSRVSTIITRVYDAKMKRDEGQCLLAHRATA